MEKNELFIGTCTGYTKDGLGIVKTDHFVMFVSDILEGETAKILCLKVKVNYGFGKVIELIEPSIHRVKPLCSVYKMCGGCHLMHMDAYEQAHFKESIVSDCFSSIAHMDVNIDSILSMDDPYRYRNKVQVPVQNNKGLKIGFYRKHSNDIIEFEDCLVQTETSNKIVKVMKSLLVKYHLEDDFRHILIKHAHVSDQIMVVFIVRKYPIKGIKECADELIKQFDNIESVIVNINDKDTNVVLGDKEYCIAKKDHIEEELLGLRFNISSRSFFQINPKQTTVLYRTALDFANITKEDTVIDLYCGTGTIGLLASRMAKKVYGIEIVSEAIEDAKENALNNDVTNIEFINADAKVGANELLKRKIDPDVVIVDPPRKGCDVATLEAIHIMSPDRLVYVSCDPATLARDCAILKTMKFTIIKIQPVDMFPHTTHVETVVLMSKIAHPSAKSL